MQIGRFYELKVGKEVDFGVYLDSELGEILLPKKYVPEGTKVGDSLEVFVHRDSEDRLLATTLDPKGQLGDFVALEVKDTNHHGAFMDWGLEKDLFVPKREQHTAFYEGNVQVVRICLDSKTDRLLGVSKLHPFFTKDISDLKVGQKVELLIYDHTDRGYLAVIDQEYSGLIYENEVFEPINIGDHKVGFIKKLREDGKIDLSLTRTGTAAMDKNKTRIMELLEEHDGFMPYHDKSDAEDIVTTFNMSKKAFKKAIGGLYKDQLITIESDGIRVA